MRERTVREASPQGAEIYVSLTEPAPYVLALEGRAGAGVAIVLNGAELGSVVLDHGGRGVLALARLDTLSGINQIVLRGVDEETLAISRITLTRPGDPASPVPR